MNISAQIASTIINYRTVSQKKHLFSNVESQQNPNLIVFSKMEALLEAMMSPDTGVPIRTVKRFFTKIHSVFTGYDFIAWLLRHMEFLDETEGLHLAKQMLSFGYIFSISDKFKEFSNDSNSYYRFQKSSYWPSKGWKPSELDYAVYLCRRSLGNKNRGSRDLEAKNLSLLKRVFSRNWTTIFMESEAQNRLDTKRKKIERKIYESQERAFWCLYTTHHNIMELDIKKSLRNKTIKEIQKEDEYDYRQRLKTEIAQLHRRIDKCTIKVSKCVESYIDYFLFFRDFDYFYSPNSTELLNPWISDNFEFWNSENLTSSRVRCWSYSTWSLLKDPLGRNHFITFLQKEYATENLLFVEAVWQMKKLCHKDVDSECQRIWSSFLENGAEYLVNVDSKSRKITEDNMKCPDRWTFDEAATHLYYLLTSDSYSRYLRSPSYKDLLENSKKKHSKILTSLTKFSKFSN